MSPWPFADRWDRAQTYEQFQADAAPQHPARRWEYAVALRALSARWR